MSSSKEAGAARREGNGPVRSALRDIDVALKPANEAIADQLHLIAELGSLREVSLWTLDAQGSPSREGSVAGRPSSGVRAAAARALRGISTPAGPRRAIIARPIGRDDDPLGALAARVPPGHSAEALELIAEATPMLAFVLERRDLLEASRQQSDLILSTERRLARFGLDLHDGPLQEASALLSEIRLLTNQLRSELAEHPLISVISGRMQDLAARATELEADLRELARTAGGPAELEGSLVPVLRAEVRAFARATGVTPNLEVNGPVDEATASQRITVLRGIQEALRNARRHGGAGSVSVVVEAQPGRLEARVEDNGRGFDVTRALARARRQGRIGLAGIDQRARLLGGSCEIRSRPGGPTSVTIRLPRWKQGAEPTEPG